MLPLATMDVQDDDDGEYFAQRSSFTYQQPDADDALAWNSWLARYQLGLRFNDLLPPSHEEVSIERVQTASGAWTTSEKFFRKHGYLAAPPRTWKDRQLVDRAISRHRLARRGGQADDALRIHCALAKDVFNVAFTSISVCTEDPNFLEILSPLGAGLESLGKEPFARCSSLCAHAMLLDQQALVIRDKRQDWRFNKLPFSAHPDFPLAPEHGDGSFNFYASIPIFLSAPTAESDEDVQVQIARLCIIDFAPRPTFDLTKDIEKLNSIGRMASETLERLWLERKAATLSNLQTITQQLVQRQVDIVAAAGHASDAGKDDWTDFLQFLCQQLKSVCSGAGATILGIPSRFDGISVQGTCEDGAVVAASADETNESSIIQHQRCRASSATKEHVTQSKSDLLSHSFYPTTYTAHENLVTDLPMKVFVSFLAREGDFLPVTPPTTAEILGWLRKTTEPLRMVEFQARSMSEKASEQCEQDARKNALDPFGDLLPQSAGTYVVVPISALDGDIQFCAVVFWQGRHIVEVWERTFVEQCATIIDNANVRRRALQSERAKLTFLQHVSHELRTPLHGVLGLASQMLGALSSLRDQGAADLYDKRQTRRLDELTGMCEDVRWLSEDLRKALDDLIELSSTVGENEMQTNVAGYADSSMNSGSEMHDDPKGDVTRMVEQICHDQLLRSCQDAEQAVNPPWIILTGDQLVIRCNDFHKQAMLRKMLQQFISNAVRFTLKPRNNTPLVSVSFSSRLDGQVTIAISDNGIGMDRKTAENYTQPFVKGNSQRSGVGIGATLGFSALTVLGGNIETRSVQNEGTTVTLRIPISSVTRDEARITAAANRRAQETKGLGVNFDDDQDLWALMSSVFKSMGLDLVQRKRCPENVEQLKASQKEHGTHFMVFLHNPFQDRSSELLIRLCRYANADQPLIILCRLPDASTDVENLLRNSQQFTSLEASWIHCYGNPSGITTQEALEKFLTLTFADGSQRLEEDCKSHRLNQRRSHSHRLSMSQPSRFSHVGDDSVRLNEIGATQILIVEDNPLNLRLLANTTKKARCTYVEAVDGQEAVEKFEEKKPRVVLLDISMPVMDGFEACRRMRQVEKEDRNRQPALIIALTALSNPTDRINGLRAGMNEWRTKPVDLRQLKSDLESWKKDFDLLNEENL